MFSVVVEKKKTKPSFVQKLNDITVEEGMEAEFATIVEGYPEPSVEWTLNKTVIEDEGRFQLLVENDNCYVMVIDSCEVDDCGMVTCTATNEVGSVTCKGKLELIKPKGIKIESVYVREKEIKNFLFQFFRNVFFVV